MAGLHLPGAWRQRLCTAVAFAIVAVPVWGAGAVDAQAASCSRAQATDLRAASTLAGALVQRGAPGNVDAAGVVQRARSRCGAAGFALAVARLTTARGEAVAGTRYRSGQLLLVGTSSAGAPVYRLDLIAMARRQATTPAGTAAAGRLEVLEALAVESGGWLTWSGDPTRTTLDAATQFTVADLLSTAGSERARQLAARSLRPVRSAAVRRSVTEGPLLASLSIAVHVERAGRHVGSDATQPFVMSVARRMAARVRRATGSTWSRIDGHWATAAEHRTLVRLARRQDALVPAAGGAATTARLTAQLTSKPGVAYAHVPLRPFYPWPLDGVLDTSTVTVRVDKPATVRLTVYAPDGTRVREVTGPALPGTWIGTWNGRTDAGSRASAGAYRYSLVTTDLAGNSTLTPGIGRFLLSVDTTSPRVRDADVRYLGGSRRRRMQVRWSVHEPLSPNVRFQLIARRGDDRTVVNLRSHELTAVETATMRLPAGAFSMRLRVVDGSGNRTVSVLGRVTLP